MTFNVTPHPDSRHVGIGIPVRVLDDLFSALADQDDQDVRYALLDLAESQRMIALFESGTGYDTSVTAAEYDRARDLRAAALKTLHATVGDVEWLVPASQAQILAMRIREAANEAGS